MRTQWKTGLLLFAVLAAGIAIAPFARADEDRGWLGVTTQTLTAELREGLGTKFVGDGALVNKVVVGSPAEKAGIRKGDIITAVNNKAITSADGLISSITALKPGAYVNLKLNRDGAFRTYNVKLGSRNEEYGDDSGMEWRSAPMPPEAPMAPRAPHAPRAFYFKNGDGGWGSLGDLRELPMADLMVRMNRGRLGVRIENLNPDLASYFGNVTKGALVVEVVDDSPAQKAGIKAGDIITRVGDTPVDDGDDLVRALRDREGKVSLSVMRKGSARSIEAELEPRPEPRVYRWNDDGDGEKRIIIEGKGDKDDDSGEMRREMESLKREMEQLRKDLEASPKKKSS